MLLVVKMLGLGYTSMVDKLRLSTLDQSALIKRFIIMPMSMSILFMSMSVLLRIAFRDGDLVTSDIPWLITSFIDQSLSNGMQTAIQSTIVHTQYQPLPDHPPGP